MKPSETGNFMLHPYTFLYNSYGSGTYDIVQLHEEVKSRSPMTYQPKQYVNIGVGQQLLNRDYNAYYHSCIWPSIEETSYYFNNDGSVNYAVKRVDRRTTHQSLSSPSWVLFKEANAENQLTVEFLNKIQERKLSLIEESKNFRETIKTIASSAERMVWYAKQMFRNPYRWLKKAHRRRDLSGGRRTGHRAIKSAGDLWLEGRYHWLPTYMTMRDAFIGLQDLIPGLPVSKKGPGDSGEFSLSEVHGMYLDSNVKWDVKYSFSHKMLCYITAESEAAAIARRYGVGGITDLTAVAWELTPWTLVMDWIVPVSDVLLAHNALKGLNAHNPCQVRKWKKQGYCSVTPRGSSRAYNYRAIQDGEIWIERYERTTSNVSSLSPNLFIADEVLNPLRIIDSLSFFSGSKWGKKIISGKT